MPSVSNGGGKSASWPVYVACGCGGCLVAAILLWVGAGIAVSVFFNRMLSGTASTPSSPPAFHYPSAAQCRVPLPGGSGHLVYLHVLGDGSGNTYGEGRRTIRLETGFHSGAECPVCYFPSAGVRVGLYWYPERNGDGPYLRVFDDTGETLIDLKRGVSRDLLRSGGAVYAGDPPAGQKLFGETTVYTQTPPKVTVEYNGKPAQDVTARFGADNGKYLGSIVRHGNLLRFEAAGQTPAPRSVQ